MLSLCSLKGFAASTILGPGATAQAVLDAVSAAAASLQPGDIFVLTYSGYGAEMPDLTGRKPNHMQVTWALYDRQLLVDEVEAACSEFQSGVRIVMVADTCYSGTVTRALGYRSNYLPDPFPSGANYANAEQMQAKNLPKDIELRTFLVNKEFYTELQQALPSAQSDERDRMGANVILISGAAANQLATDGSPNGVFTTMLMRIMEESSFEGSYRDLYHRLSELMPGSQTPNYYRMGRIDERFDRQPPFTI